MNTISNADAIIDSRDVIARIEELEGEREAYETPCDCAAASDGIGARDACDTCEGARSVPNVAAWATDNPEDAEELAFLTAFAAELSGYLPDWRHGETLIRDDYFTTYAQGLAEDCGTMPKTEGGWPMQFVTIDWDAAAEALKADYTSAEWDGVTYWGRS